MKPLKTLLLGAMLVLVTSAAFGESVPQLLKEAQTAYLRGDLENAKANFELVMKIDPRNKTALGYLKMIKAQQAKQGGAPEQEKQLQALVLPQIQFRDATLGSALDYMKNQAAKLSNNKVAVNFVVQLPDDVVNTRTVTLNLANVPFTEALRYLGDLAGVSFTYEKYAIKVTPKAGAAAPAAQAGS